jgi:hypothetical protein
MDATTLSDDRYWVGAAASVSTCQTRHESAEVSVGKKIINKTKVDCGAMALTMSMGVLPSEPTAMSVPSCVMLSELIAWL